MEREAKATQSGNTHLNGMTEVTLASIAYAATQVGYAMLHLLLLERLSIDSRQDLHCHHLVFLAAEILLSVVGVNTSFTNILL